MVWQLPVALGIGALTARRERRAQREAEAQSAANEAAERAREEQIAATRALIDRAFDAPQRRAQHEQFAAALRQYLGNQLGRERERAARNLKFSLAQQGLTGGSVDVDANRRLGDEFAEAAIANERNVQGALADLRGQDEAARLQLHNLATSGLNLANAGTRALELMRANLASANRDVLARGLGDVFSETAETYRTMREREALRRGYGYAGRQQDLYGGLRR